MKRFIRSARRAFHVFLTLQFGEYLHSVHRHDGVFVGYKFRDNVWYIHTGYGEIVR